MKGVAYLLLELSLTVGIVMLVWSDPAPLSNWCPRDSVDEQLLASSWAGDDRQFDGALRRGASIAARDATGSTPLHYAASSGDAHLVRRLIALGAQVDAADNGGVTPLMHATTNDHAHVIEILLRQGAQPTDDALNAAIDTMAEHAERVLRAWRGEMRMIAENGER